MLKPSSRQVTSWSRKPSAVGLTPHQPSRRRWWPSREHAPASSPRAAERGEDLVGADVAEVQVAARGRW
jgi:hypothetical protein